LLGVEEEDIGAVGDVTRWAVGIDVADGLGGGGVGGGFAPGDEDGTGLDGVEETGVAAPVVTRIGVVVGGLGFGEPIVGGFGRGQNDASFVLDGWRDDGAEVEGHFSAEEGSADFSAAQNKDDLVAIQAAGAIHFGGDGTGERSDAVLEGGGITDGQPAGIGEAGDGAEGHETSELAAGGWGGDAGGFVAGGLSAVGARWHSLGGGDGDAGARLVIDPGFARLGSAVLDGQGHLAGSREGEGASGQGEQDCSGEVTKEPVHSIGSGGV